MRFRNSIPIIIAALLLSTRAFAHITLETSQAVAGSFYKAVLRVPHGCDGSPTVEIRVRIPETVIEAKPRPKSGWKLAVTSAKLSVPYEGEHGTKITQGVREITWSGGNLPDDHYDEFEMLIKLPNKPNSTLYIPVVQECVKGVNRWIEIPEAGKTSSDYQRPAPALKLLPKS